MCCSREEGLGLRGGLGAEAEGRRRRTEGERRGYSVSHGWRGVADLQSTSVVCSACDMPENGCVCERERDVVTVQRLYHMCQYVSTDCGGTRYGVPGYRTSGLLGEFRTGQQSAAD